MDTKQFNTLQMEKANGTINTIIRQYKDILILIKEYKEGLTELRSIVDKMVPSKIVSQKIRQTYYDLMKDFFGKYMDNLKSWVYMRNIAIYLKNNIADYKEKVIMSLPNFDIYKSDSDYTFEVDDNTFSIPIKIKTFLESVDGIPMNFYQEYQDKHVSTNRYTVYIIDKVIASLSDISTCIEQQIGLASEEKEYL